MMKTLDTNICSYILRRHPPSVLARFAELEQAGYFGGSLFISSIVVAELRFGAAKLGSESFSRQVEEWLMPFPVRPWTEAAARCYAGLRLALERQGTPVGAMDMLIAAHALAENAVLVTHNSREFERVPGLAVEDWV